MARGAERVRRTANPAPAKWGRGWGGSAQRTPYCYALLVVRMVVEHVYHRFEQIRRLGRLSLGGLLHLGRLGGLL